MLEIMEGGLEVLTTAEINPRGELVVRHVLRDGITRAEQETWFSFGELFSYWLHMEATLERLAEVLAAQRIPVEGSG